MQKGISGIKMRKKNLLTEINLLAESLSRAASLKECDRKPPSSVLLDRALEAAQGAEKKISEQAERIADLERMVMIDPLTGLLNRRGFEKELKRVLAASRRYGEQGVMIYVDLDEFKLVNDTYGHAAGDEMLRQVSRFLEKSVRESDYVARVGGDEFVIILIRISDENGVSRAKALSRSLNKAYISSGGKMIGVRASCGIQPFDGTEDPRCLLDRADRAMYKTKRARARLDRPQAYA